MEESRTRLKTPQRQPWKDNSDNKAKQDLIQKWNLGDCNVQSLFQTCFKDRDSSNKLVELYKKYNTKDIKDSKGKSTGVLTEVSSNYKQPKQQLLKHDNKPKKSNKRLKQTLDRMYQECSKTLMPSRGNKLFQSRLRNIVEGRFSLLKDQN